jgi:hypothetical protein
VTIDPQFLAHANNLAQKAIRASTDQQQAYVQRIQSEYAALVQQLEWSDIQAGWLNASVAALNAYTESLKELERADALFNWRGDFASSLLPEFLVRIVHRRLTEAGIEPLFSTRRSIVDITLSGFRDGGWTVRQKNQDLCIGVRKDTIVVGNDQIQFVVPVVAVEAKTNIDINKLNGLDFSAERLKRTFPASRYLLVTETLDFDLSKNYAGSIDEIFVLRKQKRTDARRARAPYQAEVFEAFVDEVADHVCKADVSRTHVYDRLEGGRLINV